MPVLPSSAHLLPEIIRKEQQEGPEQDQQDQQQSYKEKKKQALFDYTEAIVRLKKLVDDWKTERMEVESNRKLRNIDLSPKQLRQEGKLLPDETIIPMRLVDTNIAREQPAYINYLKNSPRSAVFHCVEDPARNCEAIENEFTRVMTYPEWDIPFQRCIDGAETHGIDYVEIVFDPSKPGHVAIEHIGKDNLYYNKDAINLQANNILVRRYSMSLSELEDAVHNHSFSSQEVEKVCNACSGPDKQDRNVYVYKAFIKCEKVVYSAWFCTEYCEDWLKAPQKHYVGLQTAVTQMVPQKPPTILGMPLPLPVPPPRPVVTLEDQTIDIFPIFCFVYKESEEQQLVKKKGRVFLDKHKQEGMTAMSSAFINGSVRASKVYGSVKSSDPGDTSPPKQIESPLQSGGIYDKQIEFWGFPWPDPTMLSGIQWLDIYNSQEAGQVNFAVANRKDSRKTATEIGAAETQASQLTSNQVSLESTWLRLVYNFSWKIVQNRAINGHIVFLAQPVPSVDPITGQQEMKYVNDRKTLQLTYDIRPAGDIDVVKRGQKLQQLKSDWPVFGTTPLAGEFLKEIIKTAYPEQAPRWTEVLGQATQQATTIEQLLSFIQKVVPPEELATLTEQEKQQFQVMIQSAQAVAQQGKTFSPQQGPRQG